MDRQPPYELAGVDVHQAIAWAEAHAGTERTYGMLRLAGVEPQDTDYYTFQVRP